MAQNRLTSLDSLPNDILEHIYKMVHRMTLSDVHAEMKHRMCLLEVQNEIKYQYTTVTIYDSLLSMSDPFLCLPCNWEVHDVITDEETRGLLQEIKHSKLQPWCRTFNSMNGFLNIDDYLRYQNSLF
jgi:hypothetical protein